jgi:hypothetical protein
LGSNGNPGLFGLKIEAGQRIQHRIPCRPFRRSVPCDPQKIRIRFGQSATEHGQQLGSNPGALVPSIRIGGIEPGLEPSGPHVLLQLRAFKRKQRPNHPSLVGGHSGQTGRTGAGENPHQNGFDLIVGVVSCQNEIGTDSSPSGLQPGVAVFPRLGLAGTGTKGKTPYFHRQSVTGGKRPNPPGNQAARPMDPVVHVGGDEIERVMGPGCYQEIQ